jgi:hypothetical protein
MIFGYFTLFVALLIEVVGAYYSITGLAAIFSGAVVPILIMGGVLEVGKVTAAVWLKNNWHRASMQFKLYLLPAVVLLMFITSMGIFGFLSKAHNDQNLVSGDVQSKIAIYDEKIKIQKDNIDLARRALQQMDAAVDQTMSRSNDEKGADKATAIRRAQARERGNLQGEIARAQTEIVKLNDLRSPIAAEVRKVEAEVGPIKYIAKLIYDDNPDANILEKAVVWVIMMIVAVFDPLALVLILAAQQSIRWAQGEEPAPKPKKQSVGEWFEHAKKRARFWDKQPKPKDDDAIDESQFYVSTLPDVEPIVESQPNTDAENEYFATEPFKADNILKQGVTNSNPYDNIPIEQLVPQKNKKKNVLSSLDAMWSRATTVFKKDPEAEHAPVEPQIIDRQSFKQETVDDHEDGTTDAEKEAQRAWKTANPNDTIKKHRSLHNAGLTTDLPWNTPDYHPDYQAQLGLIADNIPHSGEVKGFGTQFPADPGKGDMFLRVDRLPSALYKFNGNIWIEVDKALSDQHAYDAAYIDHLISKISTGEYDPDLLSDAERTSIEQRLSGA